MGRLGPLGTLGAADRDGFLGVGTVADLPPARKRWSFAGLGIGVAVVDTGLVRPFDLRTGFSTTGDLGATGLGGAISWGGCLATGGLAALFGGFVPLWRRLLAKDVCGVPLACLVTAADVFVLNGLPTTDCDLTPVGPAFALGTFPVAAAAASGGFGAIGGAGGRTMVGRTSLGFREGCDSVDGGFATVGPAFALGAFPAAAAAASGGFGAIGGAGGRTMVGRTSLGFREGCDSADGGFTNVRPAFALVPIPLPVVFLVGRRGAFLVVALAVAVSASLRGPEAGSLAGWDGFLWSFCSATGDGLRAIRAFVANLPWPMSSCADVGRVANIALVFNRTAKALPAGLTGLEAGWA